MRNPQQKDDRYDKTGVIAGPGLLLPEKVKGGGNFYLTAVVEHVQGEQEEVEYTEQGQDENTEHGQVENIEQSQAEYT